LLAGCGESRERCDQRPAVHHPIPRLLAIAPNQVWTRDITKLATLFTGVFLNLYLILDLFSRCIVGWMVAARETSALAQQLIARSAERTGVPCTLAESIAINCRSSGVSAHHESPVSSSLIAKTRLSGGQGNLVRRFGDEHRGSEYFVCRALSS